MWAASLSLITYVIRFHFRAVEEETIERFLSLLTSINLLSREDELYCNPSPEVEVFTDDALIRSVDFSVNDVRTRALAWQSANNSHVAWFLREKLGVDV